jgi:hypothetical protein
MGTSLVVDAARVRVAFGRAWLAMTLALAAHVADEALTGFLDVYNPIVRAARERFEWFPMPTFTFGAWLTGLTFLTLVLLALTRLASDGAILTRVLAFPFAIVIGVMNGFGHLGASVFFHRWMPGTTTAPLLVVCGVWLLASNARLRSRERQCSSTNCFPFTTSRTQSRRL